MNPKERLIFALDKNSLQDALALVDQLAPYVGIFKVGLEILTSHGAPRVVDEIHKRGGKVFLDGKFHDIPNTVEKAAEAAAKLGVHLFDLHASCGAKAISLAASKKGRSKMVAVTVLTSMDLAECHEIYGKNTDEKVVDFALLATSNGADGIVCSPRELHFFQAGTLKDCLKIVPGVRPKWADTEDQKRVLTPEEAIRGGATHIVVGRPILNPPGSIGNPAAAAKLILEEIEKGM